MNLHISLKEHLFICFITGYICGVIIAKLVETLHYKQILVTALLFFFGLAGIALLFTLFVGALQSIHLQRDSFATG